MTKDMTGTHGAHIGSGSVVLTRRKIVLLDGLLLPVAFFAANYITRGNFVPPPMYLELLVVFYACWMPASLVGKKFQAGVYRTPISGVRRIVQSNLYLGYCISFVLVFFNLGFYSRMQVFITCLTLLFLNVGAWLAVHRRVAPPLEVGDEGAGDADDREETIAGARRPGSFFLPVADLALLLISFWAVHYLKRGDLSLLPEYDKLLLILIGLWFISALITGKFFPSERDNVYVIIGQWLKAGLMMMAGVAVVVFAFRLFHYSRFQGFGSVAMLSILEVILLLVVLAGRKRAEQPPDVESAEQVRRILDQAPVDTEIDVQAIRRRMMAPTRRQLEERLSPVGPSVYAFLKDKIPLDDILWIETAVEQRFEPLGRRLVSMPVRLFVNLHKLNDVRRMNQYFLEIYQSLLPGGYFVGYAHTIRTHHQWVYRKFPRLMAHLVYGVDFVFKRVMPKLPWVKNLYFAITKGRNRILSRAEMLGRLSFCGFDIVAEQELERRFWVIARKVKTPSFSTNPTYGPLVTLERVGHQGHIIKVYKLRTMHPYSEFLQSYVFDRQGLREGGKLKDDFRVTRWGETFRKLWIDELPMLYNWIRGDLKIVGVRPLSSHFLSLYDEELRRLRLQTRPGLIPPFYVDLPETFEEICASEKRYLLAYMEKPIRTDLYYGVIALYNIFFRNARSG